ncbi:MAG: NAD-dependent epimerase/dehydratase [Microbacteriaceae bacterium]|nr:NAD-dependent epimerase/dehydratase [Microbacteriaceae bacterium]
MRVFVTGASGFIGSNVVPELLQHGHTVLGMARSDEGAAKVEAMGAEVLRGNIDDLDSIRKGAVDSDAVIHLAFKHDFSDFATNMASDRAAVEAFAEVLAGTDKPFSIASGVAGLRFGEMSTELDGQVEGEGPMAARRNTGIFTLALKDKGVRSSIVRLSPTVHNENKEGFIGHMVDVSRESGVAGYVGDGSQRWPTVHVKDAAALFRLAIEQAPAGSTLHGVGEGAVTIRSIAETIGRQLSIPVESVEAEHYDWLGPFLSMDSPSSNDLTRELLGWEPTHPGLIEDLDNGHWFE